ncbi:MAG: DHH family phosphoesterase, partial [Parasporobacterium sp.]|nr:DHH family phosphoesterase [Parasporobacterium sp.]
AAFLKRNGVDVARVKGMFSDKLEDVKIKAEALRTAESLGHGFVLAVCPTATETPTVAAAQVANELLEVQGVTGSFVLLDYNEKIFISARSKGDVNVQLIMERMGGGGHLNTAGAQMYQSTIEDTKKKLILTINKMIEEGLI